MVLAHDRDREITILRKGQAIAAQSPVPPGVVGYDPRVPRRVAQDYDPPRAKALLDMCGYVDRDGDGWREQPDGRPLRRRLQVQRRQPGPAGSSRSCG